MNTLFRPLHLALLAATAFALVPSLHAQENPNKNVELSAVVVEGSENKAVPLATDSASLGILGEMSLMDAPVSVQSYSAQAVQTYQAQTVGELLEVDPSVRATTNGGHMLEHFSIRGMEVSGSNIMLNGLFDLVPAGHVPTEFIERIEVLRGPNALLGGMAPSDGLGGSINVVSKKANSEPLTELTTSWSSSAYGEAHLDLGRRYANDRFGMRANLVWGEGEMGVEDQEKARRFGSLNLDYQGDVWRMALDLYSSQEKIDNGSPAMYGLIARRGTVTGLGHIISAPSGDTNLFRDTWGRYESEGGMLSAEYDLNDAWTLYSKLGHARHHGKGLMFGTRLIVTDEDGSATGYVYNINTIVRGSTGELGVRGQFTTGAVTHQLTTSINVLDHKEAIASARNEGWSQNIYNPVAPVMPATPADPDWTTNNLHQSVAISDRMSLWDDKLSVILGARFQDIKQREQDYHESRLSPSVGLVVKPWGENTAFYANYMEGLTAGEEVPVGDGYSNEGEVFKPLVTKQIELGARQQLDWLLATLSVFQIEQPSLTEEDTGTELYLREGGERRVRGAELSLQGDVVSSVTLLGGATYLKSEQLDTDLDNIGVPNWTMNLGAQWRTPIENLELGGRAVYTGKQWADNANSEKVDAWHRFDANASYSLNVGGTPVTFNAAVNNLTDRKYWAGLFSSGYLMPASERTYRLAATISF